MHTITTRLTDGVYESIAREAKRRGVPVDEIIYDWLLEGEQWLAPTSTPDELDAFYAREDHHIAEVRALHEWYKSLAKELRPKATTMTDTADTNHKSSL